ncbi:MAG: putative sulfate exporter family transporter [Flavobacteriales bacterium]|nr:putative sulfate exporter family transporter [Flavobacteriales bacterium]
METNKNIQDVIPGVAITVVLAVIGVLLAPYIPGFNAVLIALVLGMILGNMTDWSKKFKKGMDFSSSKILELSIVLLAAGMSVDEIGDLGWQTIVIILLMVVGMLFATVALSKRINCPRSGGLLTGFGTTICGSSAIAAVAPSVAKDKHDIGISLAVVSLIGAIFMFVWPLINSLVDIDPQKMALLTGGTLHSVGNVAGAGYSISKDVGDMAVTIKMLRVALLAPAVLLFNTLTSETKPKSILDFFKLPTYLWAFIGMTILVAFVDIPKDILGGIEEGAKWLLAVAMAAIGFKTSFKTLYQSGKKVLMFGFIIYFIQVAIIILGILVLM